MRNAIVGLALLVGFSVTGVVAKAQNIVRLNGVTYELVARPGVTYGEADFRARARILAGTNKRGTLAILDTPQKQEFILRMFGSQLNGVYVGARRLPDGMLYWINGGRVQSNLFLPGEPNNFRGRESALEFRTASGRTGFNDCSPNQLNGYLVEYR